MHICIQQIASHRNGCRGEAFHAVRFTWEGSALLAIVFPGEGQVAVIDPAAAVETVAFGENSWRGDEFEPALRAAVAAWEEQEWADFHARRGRFRPPSPALQLIVGGLAGK